MEPFKCCVCGKDSWAGVRRIEGIVGQCCATPDELKIITAAKLEQLGLTEFAEWQDTKKGLFGGQG